MPHTLPPLRAVIFDLDGTLYRNPELDLRYERSIYRILAKHFRESPQAAKARFAQAYESLQRRLQRPPSKLFTLGRLGISEKMWARGHGRVHPGQLLRPDRRLQKALGLLAAGFKLGLVTNNSRANTQETLRALGIEENFDETLTLSESQTYKPSSRLYARMAGALGVEPSRCLSVGDRFHQDLEPAAAIGMKILLVKKPEDVYRLPTVLKASQPQRLRLTTPAGRRQAIAAAAAALRRGGLAVVPTDTVYGVVSLPTPAAVRWIYRAKGRPEHKPLVLLLSSARQAARFAQVSNWARGLMARHWPGGLTLVLPVRPGTDWGRILHGGRTVALRVPAHEALRAIIEKAGGAVASSSANLSGEPVPAGAPAISRRLLGFADVLLDEGHPLAQLPSTVVRVTAGGYQVLRQGEIKL